MEEIKLSKRQAEVIGLTANGLTDKEIAHRLGISPSMIQQHLKVTCDKLGARNVKQAVALHVQQKLYSKIRESGLEETIRAHMQQETGAESVDELTVENGLFEYETYLDQLLDVMNEDVL